MDRAEHADVAVIGAGIAGLSCAYELLTRGRSVVVIDRGLDHLVRLRERELDDAAQLILQAVTSPMPWLLAPLRASPR